MTMWKRSCFRSSAVKCLFAGAVVLLASCAREVEWPAAGPDDLNDVVYVARLAEGGAEVVAVSAAGESPV